MFNDTIRSTFFSTVLFVFISTFALPLGAVAEGTTVFSAEEWQQSQALILTNAEQVNDERTPLGQALTIEPTRDPYAPEAFEFRFRSFDSLPDGAFVLEVEFFDRSAGAIQPKFLGDDRFHGTWQTPAEQGSYTRLNTETCRSAYFEFAKPGFAAKTEHPHLRIVGLQYLKSIRVHPKFSSGQWEKVWSSIPKNVKSMVTLRRPMEIVTSGGIDTKRGRETLPTSLKNLRELAPLAKVLGFTSIEAYVRWDFVEPEKGRFDWSHYDAMVEVLQAYDMKWFPLLIVGSAYSLPDWFVESDENIGFVCLEHGIENPIQSIWSPYHAPHVTRFLQAFGKHYEPMGILEGVRLGPSGNFGESQYPAGGNWGLKGEPMHIHIGYWAGDRCGEEDFRAWVQKKYGRIEDVNRAWETKFASFAEVKPIYPTLCNVQQQCLDFSTWYTDSMTEWCEWWALESRKAMPNTTIYQCAGGWGFREAGTDYSGQTKSMAKLDGGVRLTNETDSFHQNFFATRLAATAARWYGVPLGYEPASSHTARGTSGRIFNTASTNGEQFFTYHSNILMRPYAIERWLTHVNIFDTRQEPVVDVAIYYPETMNKIDPGAFRYLYAWGFNPRAREVREHVEVDYLDETLIRDGFLDKYKVLVFAWGNLIDADIQATIDAWLRKGGTVIYPSFPRGKQSIIGEGENHFPRWLQGDCGEGQFLRFRGDMEPPADYGEYVRDCLREMTNLNPLTQQALRVEHPPRVYFSIQKDGHLLTINFSKDPAKVRLRGYFDETVEPYGVVRLPLTQELKK